MFHGAAWQTAFLLLLKSFLGFGRLSSPAQPWLWELSSVVRAVALPACLSEDAAPPRRRGGCGRIERWKEAVCPSLAGAKGGLGFILPGAQ